MQHEPKRRLLGQCGGREIGIRSIVAKKNEIVRSCWLLKSDKSPFLVILNVVKNLVFTIFDLRKRLPVWPSGHTVLFR